MSLCAGGGVCAVYSGDGVTLISPPSSLSGAPVCVLSSTNCACSGALREPAPRRGLGLSAPPGGTLAGPREPGSRQAVSSVVGEGPPQACWLRRKWLPRLDSPVRVLSWLTQGPAAQKAFLVWGTMKLHFYLSFNTGMLKKFFLHCIYTTPRK